VARLEPKPPAVGGNDSANATGSFRIEVADENASAGSNVCGLRKPLLGGVGIVAAARLAQREVWLNHG